MSSGRRRGWGVVVMAMIGLGGCKPSPSEKWLQECEAAEAKGDVQQAWGACSLAVTADPASKASDLAAAKLRKLEPEHERLEKEKAEQKAKASLAAEERRKTEQAAQVARLTALRRKITPQWHGFEPDGECQAKGLPPFRVTYEGGLYSENEAVALADGCAHLFKQRSEPSLNDNIFCCPGK